MNKSACIIAYTYYKTDFRVRRYAEALAESGYEVDVISLFGPEKKSTEEINGVHVHRILKRAFNEKRIGNYFSNYIKFFTRGVFVLLRRHLRKRYSVIHVHNIPDFLIFMGLIPKLTGTKLILDIHDILPEFYCQKFGKNLNSLLAKSLLVTEKLSLKFADHVIVANDIWRDKIIARDSIPSNKCTTIMNYPNLDFYKPLKGPKTNERFTLIYPGTLSNLHGVDIAIRAVGVAMASVKNLELNIYSGRGNISIKKHLEELVKDLGLKEHVHFFDAVETYKIAKLISEADVGVVPKRSGIFSSEAFSSKILDYMAAGIPIIASKTKIDEYYFDDSMIKFFEQENHVQMAECIKELYEQTEQRQRLAKKGIKYISKNNWESKKTLYYDIINQLNEG